MSLRPAYITLSITLLVTAFFTTSVAGQSPAAPTNSTEKEIVATSENKAASEVKPVKLAADETKKGDLQSEIDAVKAENAAVREQLRKMAEQQKALLEQVERLQKRLDGAAAVADTPTDLKQPDATQTATTQVPSKDTADTSVPSKDTKGFRKSSLPVQVAKLLTDDERYQDGIIIWKTSDDAKVPFMLRFNNNTQIRYLNTLSSDKTFTDHLGNVREVNRRNDITVNRSMFILGGYIWDKRLIYSLTVWTSAGAASIVVAGNIGWRFDKRLSLIAGYTGVPGSRSLVNTFPYFTSTDRSMADNFFRPGFTQGLWATGELFKNFHYQAFVGNALNSINVSATKIDTNLLLSGSVWWEPLGRYGEPGKSVNMYDDYFAKKKLRVRLGSSFTRSPEDRFSNLDVSSPENTALYNSDGVLTFSTGAFAPGVTVSKALYKMWAIDGGVKYNGLAINGQYFMRWLSNFEADGPIPETSTYDHGYELSASYFVIPKKLLVYGRSSQVFGQFRNSYEYGAGVKWHFLPTERLWLNAELFRINRSPYSGAFTPYTAGMTGWAPMIQTIIAF